MNQKLYVGNLAFSTEEASIQQLFVGAGPVQSVRLIRDKVTGQSRGFAFVEMESEDGARAAIERFHGADLDGRRLTVNEARPQEVGVAAGSGNQFGSGRRREPRW